MKIVSQELIYPFHLKPQTNASGNLFWLWLIHSSPLSTINSPKNQQHTSLTCSSHQHHMRHTASKANTNMQVKWHHPMISGGLGMDVWNLTERNLLCSMTSSLARGSKIISALPMILGVFIWTHDTQSVTPGSFWIPRILAWHPWIAPVQTTYLCETRFSYSSTKPTHHSRMNIDIQMRI